jgi:DnaJ domain
MAFKDYYAILMVHPQAEPFLIEAAYKRLAREYHPDFSQADFGAAQHNHEKMLEINEAYEVLSNPARRQSFDLEYERQARRKQPVSTQTQTITRPPPPAADPRWGNVGPTFPVPAAFGIEADYLARAQEGAAEWLRREHRIPQRVKWLTRLLSGITGIITSLLFLRYPKGKPAALLAWFVLPLLAELLLRLIEKIRDRHLLRYKFNPLYNPNPAGFQAYATALAAYEADTAQVFVARNAIYHENKACPQLASYEPMPKWFARFRKAQPCSHCCRSVKAEPKKLPPPFGKGKLSGIK